MPDHNWPSRGRRAPTGARRTFLGGLAALAAAGARLAMAPVAFAEDEVAAESLAVEAAAPPQEGRAEAPAANAEGPPAIGGLELYMLALVNGARSARGIEPLAWDATMASVARAHAEDMMRRGNVSHTGSDGSSPAQRLRRAGIEFRFGSENIWSLRGSTPERALSAIHAAMMAERHAPGLWNHIGNILFAGYRRIGIGIALTSNGVPYVSEKFAD